MNPVFWCAIVIACIIIWFCLSFAFKGIGAVGHKIWDDAKNEIISNDGKIEKEKE